VTGGGEKKIMESIVDRVLAEVRKKKEEELKRKKRLEKALSISS